MNTSRADPTRKKRRWWRPRFSLRTFLIAITLFGVVVGPYVYFREKQLRALVWVGQNHGFLVSFQSTEFVPITYDNTSVTTYFPGTAKRIFTWPYVLGVLPSPRRESPPTWLSEPYGPESVHQRFGAWNFGRVRQINIPLYYGTNPAPIADLPALQVLTIDASPELTDLSALTHLGQLELLQMSAATRLKDATPLSKIKSLRYLSISFSRIEDLSSLPRLSKLSYLQIDKSLVTDVSFLEHMKQLRGLNFYDSPIIEIDSLAHLENLEYLDISYTKVTDLTPLAGLQNLRFLNMVGLKADDLAPISKLKNLERLSFTFVPGMDLSQLAGLKKLNRLWITVNVPPDAEMQEQRLKLLEAIPNCEILW